MEPSQLRLRVCPAHYCPARGQGRAEVSVLLLGAPRANPSSDLPSLCQLSLYLLCSVQGELVQALFKTRQICNRHWFLKLLLQLRGR